MKGCTGVFCLLKGQVALLCPRVTQTLWRKRRGEITFGALQLYLLKVSGIYFTALLQIKHRISVMGWLHVPVTGLQERGLGEELLSEIETLVGNESLRADVPLWVVFLKGCFSELGCCDSSSAQTPGVAQVTEPTSQHKYSLSMIPDNVLWDSALISDQDWHDIL